MFECVYVNGYMYMYECVYLNKPSNANLLYTYTVVKPLKLIRLNRLC